MFGLLEPRLPVSLAEKHWVESRMCWMADTFGIDRLRNATVVLPTPEFFPDTFLGRPEDVAPMFERLCGHMGVASGRVELKIVQGPILFDGEPALLPDGRPAGGIYRAAESGAKERIEIVEGFLEYPMFLAAALIHELSHAILLGEGHLTGEESLRVLLADDEGAVRIAAAHALAKVPDLPEGVLRDFLPLLDPERPKTAVVLAAMIQRFGRRAERFTPRLLDCLARSLAQCNDANTAAFCKCLWAICEEPFAAAERHFGESRLELLADVQAAIRKSIPGEPWPRLSETLPFERHPNVCQSCGQKGDERWMEHDDNDQPDPIFVVLCKGCSDVLIEPHPRMYRKMDPDLGT